MNKNNDNLMYLLVRDPSSSKKDSLHYGEHGLVQAKLLMEHLKRPGPGRPLGEHGCKLFVLDVERGTCAQVEVSNA